MSPARTRPHVGFLLEPTHGNIAHADAYAGRLAAVTASAIAAPTEEWR